MAARKHTPEEAAASKVRQQERRRVREAERCLDPTYMSKKRDRENKARRERTPEQRKQANATARRSWARQTPEGRAKWADYMRRYALLRNYGITLEQWEELFERQGRACACCKATDPGSKLGWSTDHMHQPPHTLRGILCHKCNIRIGQLGDTYENVAANCARFLAYLKGASPRYLRGGDKGPADANDTLIPWQPKVLAMP